MEGSLPNKGNHWYSVFLAIKKYFGTQSVAKLPYKNLTLYVLCANSNSAGGSDIYQQVMYVACWCKQKLANFQLK